MNVLIRPLESIAEFRACEALQRRVWVLPNDLEVVPLHLLLTAHRNGGLVLGAFDGNDLVGFLFGFPAYDQAGRPKHCSHMMGVDPGCQGAGIGYQLKLAQREFALARGLDLVTWTYDPLESRNAYLNIHKLGGVCRTYIRDYYGPLDDGLNYGLPTDRFQVDWWIAGKSVEKHLAGKVGEPDNGSAFKANAIGQTPGGLMSPGPLTLDADLPTIQVETPADYQAIKAADTGLALEWRLAMRQVFEAYFAAGYTVVDFLSHRTESGRRSLYILQAD